MRCNCESHVQTDYTTCTCSAFSLPPRLGLFWSDRPYFSAAVVPGFLTDSVIKIHTYNESPHQLQSFTKFCYQEVEKCTDNFKWLQKGVQISNQGSFSLYASHSFVNMLMSYDRITFHSNTAKTGEEKSCILVRRKDFELIDYE